jgi:hypothetical protein
MRLLIFGGPGAINRALFDPYSLVHGLVGVVLAALGFRLIPMLLVAVGWEVVEHVLKNVIPSAFPHPSQDTLANSAGDVLSTVIGWAAAWPFTGGARRRARRSSA